MTIVMAFDQHREQIAFDALDTESGEVSRGRIRPADRVGFRRWLGRWDGEEQLAAALEATTGWRFMVEELAAVGAEVHLAEPAETSALRGPKKRAKTDRQDARRLRELLQAGRVPESWIPPEWILELRSKARLRHTLIQERGEWQQRIQAQLYHHGVERRRQLLVGERRAWLEALELPDAARRQIGVALAMIDSVDQQLAPLDLELRALARRQPGCRALMAHYGIGEITSVAILAELGDARRFRSSRQAVRYAGMDITVSQSDRKRSPGHLSRQGPPTLRWALFEAAQVARRPNSPDRDYYERASERLGGTAPAWRSPASCCSAASTRCANSAKRRCSPPSDPMRAPARHQLILRGRLPAFSCRHGDVVDGPERLSGRTSSPSGDTPSTIMSPAPGGPRTEIRLGARAHRSNRRLPYAHAPPRHEAARPVNPDAAFDAGSLDR